MNGNLSAVDARAEFIKAACVPLTSGHASGTLEQANLILKAHPELRTLDIHTAAILGEDDVVRRFIAADSGSATAKSGPHGWDALTYLCFSRYLRLDPARSLGFVRAAEALLNAGASPNTGFYSNDHQPEPQFESVLYGAAGVAHHAALTRLLLERGADPNDAEVPYHAPEGWNNAALKILVQSGKLNQESLATILLRKTDWHDYEGIKWLLEQGVNPNLNTHWGKTALHNALLSDNSLEIIQVLLQHGADPAILGTHPEVSRSAAGKSSASIAARRGRGDVLDLLESRGIALKLEGIDKLLAACAQNKPQEVRAIVQSAPTLVDQLRAEGGTPLAEFAGTGNTEGVRHLLDLGIPVDALYETGNGYFGIAPNSTALHVAAWRAHPSTVKLLIKRGASIHLKDGAGRTPLELAVRACVDSYWTERRSPESVQALLEAGAAVAGVPFPSGYAPVDQLLERHGARP